MLIDLDFSFLVHKLKELAEQKKHLTAELKATEHNICEVECRALERAVTVKPPGKLESMGAIQRHN